MTWQHVTGGILLAVIAAVVSLTWYTFGLWKGRREQADLRLGLYRTALDELAAANHQANKYRLAWRSAQRRAASKQRIVKALDQALMPLEGRAERYRLAWQSARWRARSYAEELPPSKPCPCAACELARTDDHHWGEA